MAAWVHTCRLDARYIFAVGEQAPPFAWPEAVGVTPTQYLPFRLPFLQSAGLVVSMFGVTCYEALYFQTPTLMLSHTDENDWGAFYLGAATDGAVRRLGPLAAQRADTFQHAIRAAWENVGERQRMSLAGAGLLDGRGVERVAEAILELKHSI
jgi:hypothetical protein